MSLALITMLLGLRTSSKSPKHGQSFSRPPVVQMDTVVRAMIVTNVKL